MSTAVEAPSTALLTDQYELTMAVAAAATELVETPDMASRPAVFELFARKLPVGRRFGVVAGVQRVVDALGDFAFTDAQMAWLSDTIPGFDRIADRIAAYRFSGQVWAYRDGELYFPHSPVVVVTGTFMDGIVLETLLLSILNFDSAVASAAARMRIAARDRTLIEMGTRRVNNLAAPAAALAAYIAGFDATSNLEAGFRYGIPTAGTTAHAFTLAYGDELEAFRTQLLTFGRSTTLLVDTYDIPTGIDNAVRAANSLGFSGPDRIRIDSGIPAEVVPAARARLDALGALDTTIALSSDLDEHTIAEAMDLPVDTFGAGTRLATGSGHPTCGFVYKLVAIDRGTGWTDVAKRCATKVSVGGRKWAHRELDHDGFATGERITFQRDAWAQLVAPHGPGRSLHTLVWNDGPTGNHLSPAAARTHHRTAISELREVHTSLDPGDPAFDATPR